MNIVRKGLFNLMSLARANYIVFLFFFNMLTFRASFFNKLGILQCYQTRDTLQ